jgi:D-arabinose 1-dehydrogenase-like Zn-dependent alcohol dehydrogenase
MTTSIPTCQRAVQLVGPDLLQFNPAKPVPEPGPHQILARVEVTGLCFSDLKLLKQFDGHVRKSAVVTHLDAATCWRRCPATCRVDRPTVPGHETVVRVVRVGRSCAA